MLRFCVIFLSVIVHMVACQEIEEHTAVRIDRISVSNDVIDVIESDKVSTLINSEEEPSSESVETTTSKIDDDTSFTTENPQINSQKSLQRIIVSISKIPTTKNRYSRDSVSFSEWLIAWSSITFGECARSVEDSYSNPRKLKERELCLLINLFCH